MLWFRSAVRPRPALRTRLRLESLDDRAVPSSLLGDAPATNFMTQTGDGVPVGVAPRIINFSAVEIGPGWYQFTGQVVDSATVGGLTIDFGGVPSLEPAEATTQSDGTFSLTIRVQTDGSDHGTVTAQTTSGGLTSNLAQCEIAPTP